MIYWVKFEGKLFSTPNAPDRFYRHCLLRTKGSCGPSGVDANGFKRMLACKSFKKSSTNLCDSLATLARRLCTEFVDPLTIELILASRLIPLDKGNGDIRPIGVGEVVRRIIGAWKMCNKDDQAR